MASTNRVKSVGHGPPSAAGRGVVVGRQSDTDGGVQGAAVVVVRSRPHEPMTTAAIVGWVVECPTCRSGYLSDMLDHVDRGEHVDRDPRPATRRAVVRDPAQAYKQMQRKERKHQRGRDPHPDPDNTAPSTLFLSRHHHVAQRKLDKLHNSKQNYE